MPSDANFDFLKFEDELSKRFAAELKKLALTITDQEHRKIINAHDKALAFALFAAAPPGSVT